MNRQYEPAVEQDAHTVTHFTPRAVPPPTLTHRVDRSLEYALAFIAGLIATLFYR